MFSSIKIYIYLAIIAILLGGGFYAGYRYEESVVLALELKYQEASTKAISDALAKKAQEEVVANQIAQAETLRQQQILNQTKAHLDAVNKYIKNTCITWDTIRLLNGTILHSDPSSLSIPAGKLGSSCSGVAANTVIKVIINNYGIAQQNAAQLNSILDWYARTR